MSESHKKVVIKGVTKDGRRFRPSDWAQRLTTSIATIGRGRRITFHPRVRMATVEGVNCVVVDTRLAEEDPLVYEFLLNFATSNELQVSEQ